MEKNIELEKDKKTNIKIICVKAPKWAVPFLKMFYKKENVKVEE